MKPVKGALYSLFFLALLHPRLSASEKILLRIEGGYLAYSYDYSQIYGEKIEFKFSSSLVSSRYLKVDIPARTFLAYGQVILKNGEEKVEADEFLFSPLEKKASFITYKDAIKVREWEEARGLASEAKDGLPPSLELLHEISLSKIQKSLIFSTAKIIEITPAYEVYGYDVTLYVEGLESVGFKKIKLSLGDKPKRSGIGLDKIWFTRSQGLLGKISYAYEKENKIQSITQMYYEEHSILKNYSGLKRQMDLQSNTSWSINKNLKAGLVGSYNSTSLWNTRLWFDKKWNRQKNSLLLDFSYNRPIHLQGEAWFGLQSALSSERWGNVSFLGKYELQNQALANFSYEKTFFNKIHFLLASAYSQVKMGGGGNFSKIFTGQVNLSYASKIINLSTDYYLNYDLFGNQLLSRPQLRFGFSPFIFYDGILSAALTDVFIYNNLKGESSSTASFSNNLMLNLAARPISIQKSFLINFHLALEQFLEKEGRNFTSGGFILKANKTLAPGISLEGFYSLQSRRKSKAWLVEGTTSQDLSALFKVNPSERLSGWVSLSFDPKNSEWRQSFAEFSLGLIKNWKLQSLLNYDFYRRKINNVDLYLIREAGRFDLRFIWRSISRQILVEFVPK